MLKRDARIANECFGESKSAAASFGHHSALRVFFRCSGDALDSELILDEARR
jgi:hypothetical protein